VASGIVTAEVKDLENVEQWRKAARLDGRQLGYPIRTSLSRDGETVCAIPQRPTKPGDQRRAAELVASLIFGPDPPDRPASRSGVSHLTLLPRPRR
jgi:hypothetical protein